MQKIDPPPPCCFHPTSESSPLSLPSQNALPNDSYTKAQGLWTKTPIKINLALHVTGQKADGYHMLDSLVIFSENGDDLEIFLSSEDSFCLKGRYAHALSREKENLVLKARNLLRTYAGLNLPPVAINLVKNLPLGAGLGGGSGDAAATLILLNRLWKLELSQNTLLDIALQLGADVPACLFYLLEKCPIYMSGIGDKITKIQQMPSLFLVLINPGVAVPTKEVFCSLHEKNNPPLEKIYAFSSTEALLAYLEKTRNDLLKPALSFAPNVLCLINTLKENGAIFAGMSGSGSTCFGLFPNNDRAKKAADFFAKTAPRFYIQHITIEHNR